MSTAARSVGILLGGSAYVNLRLWVLQVSSQLFLGAWRPRDPVVRGAAGGTLPRDLETQGKELPRETVYLAYGCRRDTVLKGFSALENTCTQKNSLLILLVFRESVQAHLRIQEVQRVLGFSGFGLGTSWSE